MIRLNELRGQRTQAQMAQQLGLPRETYRNYEVGNREPPLETLIKMATFFGVSVDYLLGLDEPTQSKSATPAAQAANYHTPQEDELLTLFRELSPYLRDLTIQTVRGWAGKTENPSAINLQKKA